MKNIFFLILVASALGFTACGDTQTNTNTPSNSQPPANTNKEISQTSPADDSVFNVSVDYWKKQRDKAIEKRQAPVGSELKGLKIPEELKDNDGKQKTTLEAMKNEGFNVPMDFFDLAEKNLDKKLVELPLATETYLLDVGGSTTDKEFTAFTFQEGAKFPFEDGVSVPDADSAKQKKLKELADKFKLDLSKKEDRRLLRMRLVRMLDPKAKPVLEEIAKKYQAKFDRPLRVVSLVRSIDYQISLNKVNANSFLVRENGLIPPHCTGLVFDFSLKHLTAEEQNFIADILLKMEKNGKVDAVRETGLSAVFHIFVL